MLLVFCILPSFVLSFHFSPSHSIISALVSNSFDLSLVSQFFIYILVCSFSFLDYFSFIFYHLLFYFLSFFIFFKLFSFLLHLFRSFSLLYLHLYSFQPFSCFFISSLFSPLSLLLPFFYSRFTLYQHFPTPITSVSHHSFSPSLFLSTSTFCLNFPFTK